jgi:hypothetical protein
LPLTRIVPSLAFLAVETTTLLAARWVVALAVPAVTTDAESPPTAKIAAAMRPTGTR